MRAGACCTTTATSRRSTWRAMGSGSSASGPGCPWSSCLKRQAPCSLPCSPISRHAICICAGSAEGRSHGQASALCAACRCVPCQGVVPEGVLGMLAPGWTPARLYGRGGPERHGGVGTRAGGGLQAGGVQASGAGVWAHHSAAAGAAEPELVGRQSLKGVASHPRHGCLPASCCGYPRAAQMSGSRRMYWYCVAHAAAVWLCVYWALNCLYVGGVREYVCRV